jgi:hypothetical protein
LLLKTGNSLIYSTETAIFDFAFSFQLKNTALAFIKIYGKPIANILIIFS